MDPRFVGTVPVYGEEGKTQIEGSFVERLGGLSPTKRRLGIAHACALPWRDKPAELPGCYKSELEIASWEADEEDRARGFTPDHEFIEDLFDLSEPPINEVFLRQLVRLGPATRRSMLVGACAAPWWIEKQPPPEWITVSYKNLAIDGSEEGRLQSRRDLEV